MGCRLPQTCPQASFGIAWDSGGHCETSYLFLAIQKRECISRNVCSEACSRLALPLLSCSSLVGPVEAGKLSLQPTGTELSVPWLWLDGQGRKHYCRQGQGRCSAPVAGMRETGFCHKAESMAFLGETAERINLRAPGTDAQWQTCSYPNGCGSR